MARRRRTFGTFVLDGFPLADRLRVIDPDGETVYDQIGPGGVLQLDPT